MIELCEMLLLKSNFRCCCSSEMGPLLVLGAICSIKFRLYRDRHVPNWDFSEYKAEQILLHNADISKHDNLSSCYDG